MAPTSSGSKAAWIWCAAASNRPQALDSAGQRATLAGRDRQAGAHRRWPLRGSGRCPRGRCSGMPVSSQQAGGVAAIDYADDGSPSLSGAGFSLDAQQLIDRGFDLAVELDNQEVGRLAEQAQALVTALSQVCWIPNRAHRWTLQEHGGGDPRPLVLDPRSEDV